MKSREQVRFYCFNEIENILEWPIASTDRSDAATCYHFIGMGYVCV